MDPDGSSARAEETGGESSSFPDIGTRKSRVKENTKEVSKMGGTTLKQAGKSKRLASAGSAPKFVPYKDPEQGEGEIEMPPPPVPASKSIESVAVPQTPSRRGFVPFRDADGAVILPSTPRFTPYRDEVRFILLYCS
jgi:spindle assembly checkpoint component MAD3